MNNRTKLGRLLADVALLAVYTVITVVGAVICVCDRVRGYWMKTGRD